MKIRTFIKGIMAGICISLGGWLFINCKANMENGLLIGSLYFSIGLILICNLNYFLYTGKVCFIFERDDNIKLKKILKLIIGLLGNIVGTIIMGLIFRVVLNELSLSTKTIVDVIGQTKEEMSILKMLICSFFCGMFVYFAVKGYKIFNNIIMKNLSIVVCISAFIISGFEHCIANMFYLSISFSFSIKSILNFFICVVGNSLGGICIPLISNVLKDKNNS